MAIGPDWLAIPTPGELERRWWPGLVALLAGNVVPLVGVVALGWDLGVVLLLYWLESAIILLFSLTKVGLVSGRHAPGLILFFLVHAGMFMGGHLVFLVAVFTGRPSLGDLHDLAVGAATLFGSHLVSFIANTVVGKERPATAQAVMTGFYARIVVMHLTIIFGAMLLGAFGSPVWALVLLIVLKTLVDAGAHVRERLKNAVTSTWRAMPKAA